MFDDFMALVGAVCFISRSKKRGAGHRAISAPSQESLEGLIVLGDLSRVEGVHFRRHPGLYLLGSTVPQATISSSQSARDRTARFAYFRAADRNAWNAACASGDLSAALKACISAAI